jgi:hypothetical protein
MTELNTAGAVYLGAARASAVYVGANQAWPQLPARLPGLLFWLDASKLPGAIGSAVSTWPDLSGNRHDCTAIGAPPTLQASPNGLPWVQFNGAGLTAAGLAAALSDRAELGYALMLWPTAFNNSIVIEAPSTNVWDLMVLYGGGGAVYVGTKQPSYRLLTPPAPGVLDDWNLVTIDMATDTRLWLNAVEVTTYSDGGGGVALPTISLGTDAVVGQYYNGNFPWLGQMAEICVYDHALADTDRQALERYLHAKWLKNLAAIPGLLWWLDASQLALSSGADVTTWPDRGPSHYDATATETPPTFVPGAVRFAASSNRMRVAGLGTAMSGRSDYSIVCRFNSADVSNWPVFFTSPYDALWQWMLELDASTSGIYVGSGNGRFRLFNGVPVQTNAWSVMSVTVTNGLPRLWLNGAEVTSYQLGPNGDCLPSISEITADVLLCGYYAGPSYSFTGDIAHLALYDHALTDAERQTAETYLNIG